MKPLIDGSVVDLPAPLEPISVTISPVSTAIVMPLSAWIGRRTYGLLDLEHRARRVHSAHALTAAAPR